MHVTSNSSGESLGKRTNCHIIVVQLFLVIGIWPLQLIVVKNFTVLNGLLGRQWYITRLIQKKLEEASAHKSAKTLTGNVCVTRYLFTKNKWVFRNHLGTFLCQVW